MSKTRFRVTKMAAALLAIGLAAGVSAQGTDTTGTANKPKSPAVESSQPGGGLASADRKFVEKAASGGMMEVQLGQLAQQKASSEQVKQFGARMAEDHAKANDELKQIATAKGATVPAAMEKSHQRDLQRLEKLSGAEFDRAYMKHMVDDHKDDLSAFRKQAKSGKDPELKGFAEKTLPTLQEHMKLAQTTYNAVKDVKKTTR